MRRMTMYFAWSRPEETSAPLGVIENRFPALFEARRMRWPKYEAFRNPEQFDQGITGFLDHIQMPNFIECCREFELVTGNPVQISERNDGHRTTLLTREFLSGIDTLIIIGFDSNTTGQRATDEEIAAIREFLAHEDHLVFVCPHHDIGDVDDLPQSDRPARLEAEFYHHGDATIPPIQRFGGFGLSLLAAVGLPVRNRYGLRPAVLTDGMPAALHKHESSDRLKLLRGVPTFNLHPHLPQLERLGDSQHRFEVLAEQEIDLSAPTHPFLQSGRTTLDALLQSRPEVFSGTVFVCDTTLWSSTAGAFQNLQRFWRNVANSEVPRPQPTGT